MSSENVDAFEKVDEETLAAFIQDVIQKAAKDVEAIKAGTSASGSDYIDVEYSERAPYEAPQDEGKLELNSSLADFFSGDDMQNQNLRPAEAKTNLGNQLLSSAGRSVDHTSSDVVIPDENIMKKESKIEKDSKEKVKETTPDSSSGDKDNTPGDLDRQPKGKEKYKKRLEKKRQEDLKKKAAPNGFGKHRDTKYVKEERRKRRSLQSERKSSGSGQYSSSSSSQGGPSESDEYSDNNMISEADYLTYHLKNMPETVYIDSKDGRRWYSEDELLAAKLGVQEDMQKQIDRLRRHCDLEKLHLTRQTSVETNHAYEQGYERAIEERGERQATAGSDKFTESHKAKLIQEAMKLQAEVVVRNKVHADTVDRLSDELYKASQHLQKVVNDKDGKNKAMKFVTKSMQKKIEDYDKLVYTELQMQKKIHELEALVFSQQHRLTLLEDELVSVHTKMLQASAKQIRGIILPPDYVDIVKSKVKSVQIYHQGQTLFSMLSEVLDCSRAPFKPALYSTPGMATAGFLNAPESKFENKQKKQQQQKQKQGPGPSDSREHFDIHKVTSMIGASKDRRCMDQLVELLDVMTNAGKSEGDSAKPEEKAHENAPAVPDKKPKRKNKNKHRRNRDNQDRGDMPPRVIQNRQSNGKANGDALSNHQPKGGSGITAASIGDMTVINVPGNKFSQGESKDTKHPIPKGSLIFLPKKRSQIPDEKPSIQSEIPVSGRHSSDSAINRPRNRKNKATRRDEQFDSMPDGDKNAAGSPGRTKKVVRFSEETNKTIPCYDNPVPLSEIANS